MGKASNQTYHRNCKQCGNPFTTTYRLKMFDKHDCGVMYHNRKKYNKYAEGKKQCNFCDGWFVKVLTHVWQVHHLTAKEYKEHYDLPLKRGIIPDWHKNILKQRALENNMDKQLTEAGKKTRYKKGDPKAKLITGWKGRTGNKGYIE